MKKTTKDENKVLNWIKQLLAGFFKEETQYFGRHSAKSIPRISSASPSLVVPIRFSLLAFKPKGLRFQPPKAARKRQNVMPFTWKLIDLAENWSYGLQAKIRSMRYGTPYMLIDMSLEPTVAGRRPTWKLSW